MKFTKKELQKIVKEELQKSIKQGELDELGFKDIRKGMKKIFGKKSPTTDLSRTAARSGAAKKFTMPPIPADDQEVSDTQTGTTTPTIPSAPGVSSTAGSTSSETTKTMANAPAAGSTSSTANPPAVNKELDFDITDEPADVMPPPTAQASASKSAQNSIALKGVERDKQDQETDVKVRQAALSAAAQNAKNASAQAATPTSPSQTQQAPVNQKVIKPPVAVKDAVGTPAYKKSMADLTSILSNFEFIDTQTAQKMVNDIHSMMGNGKFSKLVLSEQEHVLNISKILDKYNIQGPKRINLIKQIKKWAETNSQIVQNKIGSPTVTPLAAPNKQNPETQKGEELLRKYDITTGDGNFGDLSGFQKDRLARFGATSQEIETINSILKTKNSQQSNPATPSITKESYKAIYDKWQKIIKG